MNKIGAAAGVFLLAGGLAAANSGLEQARDRQDRPALEKTVVQLAAAADKAPGNAEAQYRAALASSYLGEVALELRDKDQAQRAAENGIRYAERAVALQPRNAEYYRVLGTLCGQVIPANILAGLAYGKRARDAVDKALELDPRSPRAYLARGVGNYYLPAALGGGLPSAATDFRRTIELDPASADAWLWLGLTLRRQGRNGDARQALSKALELDPQRLWIKQQLDKTPPQ